MAVNYDEKILAVFGKRNKKSVDPNKPDELTNGLFVVDPNKVVTEDDTIKPRYIKQEDLVMYANITARLNPDSTISNNGSESTVITIGRVGVNFLNPLKSGAVNPETGNVEFNGHKDKFTTGWSDYFTSNDEEGNFYDPETFGISNIDVTHNSSLTPIIKVDFIDVQGRTLLERGDDESNPYNIFYRFPYPLFTLTIKGYFGKAIEYPLSMTKTSTTFDSTSGNYVIKAEFLSRTFSVYNNFLMSYAAVAPYMYLKNGTTNDYLGKRILQGLYQKQNEHFKLLYGENSKEYKKHEFIKYPTIQDLSRGSNVLNYENLSIIDETNTTKNNNEIANKNYSLIDIAYTETLDKLTETNEYVNKRNDNDYYLTELVINDIINDDYKNVSEVPFLNEVIDSYKTSLTYLQEEATLSDLRDEIYYSVINSNQFTSEYTNKISKTDLSSDLLSDELFIVNNTSSKDKNELNKVYYTFKYFKILNGIITKILGEFYQKKENNIIDDFTFQIKEKIGYVPNMANVVRILMNNMQVFVTMLNLVGLNSANQLNNDIDRQTNQKRFGEIINDKWYPFPNYYRQRYDENIDDSFLEKQYPGSYETSNWFEVQFVEEIFRGLTRLGTFKNGALDSESILTYEYKEQNKPTTNLISDKKFGLISTLLVENNLDYYNIEQTATETFEEFITKILMFGALGFVNTTGTLDGINGLAKIMTEHEYDLITRRISNVDKDSKHQYLNDLYNNYYDSLNSTKDYSGYCSIRVTGGVNLGNYEAVITNLANPINELRDLIETNYTDTQFKSAYSKIEGVIGEAVNINDFKRLYDYKPLEYKNKKNTNGLIGINSLFFKGLEYHDEYEGYSPSLSNFNSDFLLYQETFTPSYTAGYYYNNLPSILNTNFKYDINNKVSTNTKNSNALALAIKDTGLDTLNPDKKNKNNTRYSKINL